MLTKLPPISKKKPKELPPLTNQVNYHFKENFGSSTTANRNQLSRLFSGMGVLAATQVNIFVTVN